MFCNISIINCNFKNNKQKGIKMKFVRFLKIFAICLGGLIGVTGVSMGIMYLAGYFDTKTIYPEQIAFVQNEYQVEGDFKMMINTPTEDVNALDVTLSFEGIQSSGDTISDGVISVPKYVKIGKEFDVKVVKSPQVLNGQTVDWVNGGISKLVASCENINARKAQTQIFVDVPVFDINIKTSISSEFDDQNLQSNFNVDSEFFALAEFVPARSMYKYSRDTQYGGQAQYKTVFFSTLSNAISMVETNNLDRYIKKFKANSVTDGAQIVAQAFSNSSTENQAYDAVSNFDDPDLKYNNLLSILQNAVDVQKAVSKTQSVNVKQLLVGNFAMDTTKTVPARYNQSTKIYANKSSLGDNEYSLDAKIFATDNQTLLSNQITKLGLVVLKQTGTGYELAKIYTEGEDNSDADVFVLASARKEVTILNFENTATVFLPVENRVNINQSYWEIAPLKENINLHFAIVLFDQDFAIREFSFKNTTTREPKFIFDIQSVQVISNQVYWTNPLNEEKSLYIYDGATPAENVAEEYDLKQHQIFVGDNTYTQTKYFAYLEMNDGTIVNPNKGEAIDPSKDLSKFIATAEGRIYKANISSGVNALLYELPDGVVKALYNTQELDGKIKVLFATLKTDFSGSILKDADGNFVVDRYSSNSNIGCQTMTFATKKTLVNVKAQVALDAGDDKNAYFDAENNLFAVKINTNDCFEIKFDLQQNQKDIFKRDFEEGKISVDFFVNGQKNNSMFVTTFDVENASAKVTVGEFDYEPNDSGYRNISIKINYLRGNGNVVTTDVTNYFDINNADNNSSILQVYDGKINQISFADFEKDTPAMQNNSEQNPIIVSTNLEKEGDAQNGIFEAKSGSSYLIKLDDIDVSEDLMDEKNQIKVVAKDKYGKQITETGEDLYWELVSSNEDILKVNNATKTITFAKSSTETVWLKVRTYKVAGVGNRVVECERNIFFKVQTGGRIVKVEKQTINSGIETVFDNLGEQVEQQGVLENKFKLKDNQKNFSETSLELEILGKSGNEISLLNLVKICYGLEADNDSFEIFDLKNILQWTRIDKNNLNGFVSFKNIQNAKVDFAIDQDTGLAELSNDKLLSFAIEKNFGKIGYMNLRISSEIGINLSVNITIRPFVDASITNTYSHEQDGAASLAEGNITYLGVYAQKEIDIKFLLNFDVNATATDKHSTRKIVYYICKDASDQIEKIGYTELNKVFNNSDGDKTFDIRYIFDDVTANTKYKMTVVLDTSDKNLDNDFEKLAYDYFADVYFYVNPNITCVLQDGEDTDNDGRQDTKQIGAYQNELVKNVLKISDAISDNVIDVKRIVGSQVLNFEKTNDNKPYVYAKLVDEKGNDRNYTFFELSGEEGKLPNTLKIREGKLLSGKQNVYIGVFYGTNEESDLRLFIYNFVVTPSLNENKDLKDENNENLQDKDGVNLDQKMGFVQYGGKTYLQLLTGMTYEFDDIAKCFVVKDEQGNIVESSKINAEFDLEYINQTRYWTIINPTIQIGSNINMLVVDQLFVNLTIQGVGTIKYPVLITPQLALYVNYIDDDSQNNILANQDLYINQTASELAKNDIYDIVQDSTVTNIFANETKLNGIKKVDGANYTFEIKDENGNNFVNNFASIDEYGNLTVDAIGEDRTILIVAKLAGFDILYRIKIMSSLKLETFYPYIENLDEDGRLIEDRAEYVLFANNDTDRKSFNLTEEFSSNIPAHSQKITIFEEDKNQEKNITQRFMMFRYDQTQKRIQVKETENLEFLIKNIQSGTNVLRDIDSSLWGQYAALETNQNTTNLILSKMGNYVVTIQVYANNGASAEYVVRVELSSKNYTLVQSKSLDGTQDIDDITKMPNLSGDDIVISSPVKDEKENVSLEYIKLKMISGSTSSDKTSELGYLIVDQSGKLSFDKQNKQIVCDYTANDINAQIIFFTKYGEVGRRNIKVNSITKALEKAEDGTLIVDGTSGYKLVQTKTLYSGQIVNLEELFVIAVQNDDGTWTKQTATYTEIGFDKTPSWLVGIQNNQFVILPLKEGVQDSLTVTAHCKIGADGQDFQFTILFDIKSGITSKKPASLDPVLGGVVVAGKDQVISIFEDLFDVENAINFAFDNTTKSATATLANVDGKDITYRLVYEVQSGISVLDLDNIVFENNTFKITTKATASDTTVKFRFVLELEYEGHRFESACFYQFVVTPDSDVVVNYPNIDGQEFTTEKLYFADEFCLDKEPIFGQKGTKRVQITPKDGIGALDIKVNYQIVQGAVDIIPANNEGNSIDQKYTFTFGDDASFALVEFEIYVSELQRATYSLELYKNFNCLYSVNVQTLNQKEDLSEVFYIAEGRQDIFNGPQAFKFIVSNIPSLLSTPKKFEYFADNVSLGEFELDASSLGQSKTIILPYQSGLEKLNLKNLKFKINGDTKFYTLDELSAGEMAYFTKNASGNVNFEIFSRIRIQYLGIDVTNYTEFLQENIKLIGNGEGASSTNTKNFVIDYVGLGLQDDGTCNTEIEKSLKIVYQSENNVLGNYYYKVKSDLQVTNKDTINITAGENIDKLLSVFGVVDHNKNLLVDYKNNAVQISDQIKNQKLILGLEFNKFEQYGNDVYFEYLDTRQKYEANEFQPMTYSHKVMDIEGGNIVYDFEIQANGAPNSGLYCELAFTWVYKISDNSAEDLTFKQIIPVEIQSNVQIELKNLDGSNNSAANPQKITSEMYSSDGVKSFYNLVLIDKENIQSALVNAYKINTSTTENFAYDLAFNILNAKTDACQMIIAEQSKSLTIYKPDFSVKDIQIQLSDKYGYTKIYYLQAEPTDLISFVQITGRQVFEKDTFVLKNSAITSDADHEIVLSKTDFTNDYYVSYRLLAADGTDLFGISNSNLVGAGTMLRFNTLDSTVFSASTKTVYCYLEITIKYNDESYTINSNGFTLRQRYSSNVIDQSARDGVEFELNDKVSFFDNKIDGMIAKPLLFAEKTLVVEDQNIKDLIISAKLKTSSVTKTSAVSKDMLDENVAQLGGKTKSFLMMKNVFGENLIENYNFYVTTMSISVGSNILKLTVNSSKLKSLYTDADGKEIVDAYNFGVVLYDGMQYVIANVTNTNPDFDLSKIKASYQNAIFGIVGYKQNDNLPKVYIQQTSGSGSYITKMAVDKNGYDQSIYSAEYVFTNIGDLGGFDKKQIKLSQIDFGNNKAYLNINGINVTKDMYTSGEQFLIDLTPNQKQTVSNEREQWLLTQTPYSEQANICDDKRIEVITVENFGETNSDVCEFTQNKLVKGTDIKNIAVDGGKLKFGLSNSYKIENIYVIASKDGVLTKIFPQSFEKISNNQYAFKLEEFGLQSYLANNFEFYTQSLQNKTNKTISVQLFTSSKNLTQDLILSANQKVTLDVSQGLWNKVYDRENAETVDIELSGGNKLTVSLDRNGKQEFSLLKQGITNVKDIVLSDQSYEQDFVQVDFFDDTLGFKVGSANSGSLKFVLSRTRDGQTTEVIITVALYSYSHTYFVGLTDQFGEMPKQGDKYALTCTSKSNSYASDVVFFVPYKVDGQKQVTIKNEDLELGTKLFEFEVKEMNAIAKDKINFDSKEQYEAKAGTQKYMSVEKYYLAKYHGAYYQVKPNFFLTPYFYELNLDKVSQKESNSITISDYTQSKDDNGKTNYTINLKNWAEGIRFNDINGNVIKDLSNEDILFVNNTSKLHCSIVSDSQSSGGSGSAEIDDNFNIIVKNVSNISLYHITLKIQVALGGNDKNQDTQWLDIGSITLQFNSKNQYQIPFGSKFVISNRNQSIETFRFVAYGDEESSSGENLSFSASRLFDDQTIVDMSQVRTMTKDGNKIYLLEEENSYQLSYNTDEKTKVAVVAKSKQIETTQRKVFVYGLTKGNSITIKAKISSTSEDYVYATYKTEEEVFYGTVALSDLSWKSMAGGNEVDITTLSPDKNNINYYNYFEIDSQFADKCCVPLSYVDLDNFDQNGSTFKSISNYYDASSFDDGNAQFGLIANDNFRYSKTFELAKLESENLQSVKAVMPANSVKFFQLTQNDTEGNIFSQIQKLENTSSTSSIVDVNIETDASKTGLGTLLGVVIKDITTTNKSNTSFDLSSISFLKAKQGMYKIDFKKGDTELNLHILKYFANDKNMSQFKFLQYLYNQKSQVFDSSEQDTSIVIKMAKTASVTLQNCQIIKDVYGTYSYSNYAGEQTLVADQNLFKPNGDIDENITLTIFDTTNSADNTILVWHEYKDSEKQSKTGYLYYCQGNESKNISTDQDLKCPVGSTISLLWDGTKTFANITAGKTYVLKIVTNDGTADEKYLFVAKGDNYSQNAFDIKTILQGLGFDMNTTPMPLRDKVEILSNVDFVYTDKGLVSNIYYFAKYDDVKKAIIYFDSQNLQNLQNLCAILGTDYAHIDKIGFEEATDLSKNVMVTSGYYFVKTSNKNVIVKFEQDGALDFCALQAIDGIVYNMFENGYVDTLAVSKINTHFVLDVPTIVENANVKIVCGNAEKIVSATATDGKITLDLDEDFIRLLDIQNFEDGSKIKFVNWNKEDNVKVSGPDAFEKEFSFVEVKDLFA